MCIWDSNELYADEYKEAIHAIQEAPYTMKQTKTAMSCSGDEARNLCIPEFLEEINQFSAKKEIINNIEDYLAAAAMIRFYNCGGHVLE